MRSIAMTLVASLVLEGCFYAVHSTASGRREARRECLGSARARGWTVDDISEARWLGAARHEVLMTIERGGAPAERMRCVYDQREHLVDLTEMQKR